MENNSIKKSALLMLVIVIAAVTGYEMYVRNSGADVAYDDGPEMWSEARSKVYGPSESQIVFIGSSRIKYDLDIPTWKTQTGLDAVQLAIVGSTPLPLLHDLANDPEFKGRLVVDVTEPLFFSNLPPYLENPNKNIKYFHDRTYAQQASFHLGTAMESQFVFLDKENYAMNAQLSSLHVPNRPGIFEMPTFPRDFGRTATDRQTYMSDSFVADSMQVNQVRAVWNMLLNGPKGPPMTDAQIFEVIESVKMSVDKIKARGGEVIFVRTPSSGPFLMAEKMGFPREKYWDRLLKVTGCEGIHFADYPATAGLQCPEFSHLNKSDAKLYTQQFIKILGGEKRWAMNPIKNQNNF